MNLNNNTTNLDIFNFSLPQKNIAQNPKSTRSSSKLLVIDRKTHNLTDDKFENIDKYLTENDLLIINDTKVIPARLYGKKEKTLGKVEIFFERAINKNKFYCQIKSTRKLAINSIIIIDNKIKLKVEENNEILCIIRSEDIEVGQLFQKFGVLPLPPYIRRKPNKNDENYYQTIFAKKDGSVAAPTAALHFDEKIKMKIQRKGIQISNITLHIGMGTFSPIKTNNIDEHKMHSEFFCVPKDTLRHIEKCKKNNGKVIAVGTTVARALESFFSYRCKAEIFQETDIFIKPGYKFKVVDSIITNFHLPKSTLLIMIAAFYDINNLLGAYDHAIKNNYKFFSYGDSTLVL